MKNSVEAGMAFAPSHEPFPTRKPMTETELNARIEEIEAQIYDYTVKLATDNAVELSDDELDLNNGAIINLLSYLKVQKRIFETAA